MPGHACRSKLLIFAISCKNLSDAFLDTTGVGLWEHRFEHRNLLLGAPDVARSRCYVPNYVESGGRRGERERGIEGATPHN